MLVQGRVWKFGDDINTDLIVPGKYLFLTELKEVAKHAMEGIDPSFATKVSTGDLIVAGSNFGCGSSRELAPAVLKELGIGAVIAVSFARIFFRNAINIGLPVIECPQASMISDGEYVKVDLALGLITAKDNLVLQGLRLNDFMLDIIQAGGLVALKRQQRNLPPL
ncbi:MAG: 3-isopropylmalate dehydratase small subunit [Bacillota bacterium]